MKIQFLTDQKDCKKTASHSGMVHVSKTTNVVQDTVAKMKRLGHMVFAHLKRNRGFSTVMDIQNNDYVMNKSK